MGQTDGFNKVQSLLCTYVILLRPFCRTCGDSTPSQSEEGMRQGTAGEQDGYSFASYLSDSPNHFQSSQLLA
jgi:hypothetical protein